MKRTNFTIFALIVSCMVCGSAHAAVSTFDIGTFDGLNIGDSFNVTVVSGSASSVEVEASGGLDEALTCEVENGILKLYFDKGRIPKDMKPGQLTKQRFNVSIMVADPLNFVKICGKSSICVQEGTISGEDVSIFVTDQAEVSSLPIANAGRASLILSKKARAAVDVSASTVMVSTDNGATLTLKLKVTDCTVEAEGSSTVVINGEASTCRFVSDDSAHFIVNGKADSTSYRCQGLSETNASNAESRSVNVDMSGGCSLSVSATERLSIGSLTGGSRMEYYGEPAISIGQIKNSSVLHAEQK